MHYSGYELLAFFLIYSFFGWIMEVVFAAANRKKFANRGFLNGPICPLYGGSIVFILVFFESLKDNLFFLFLGSMIVTTMLELLTGMIMEKMLGRKWWDYSGYRFNFGGYVCLQFSLVWGVGAVALIKFVQPALERAVGFIPKLVGQIFLLAAAVVVACDFLVTMGALLKMKKQNRRMQELAKEMHRLTGRMGNAITGFVQKRMVRAFPNLGEGDTLVKPAPKTKEKSDVFAAGCGFHKLVWLFFIGSFLGDVTETVFCRFAMGRWMSRSSVIYGWFSVVWGIGVVMLTILLHRYRDKSLVFIFSFGTVIGGAYEYICSVFTELVFGTVFWDYSGLPYNLGGRINLLYCFFWGFAAIAWLKLIYPFLTRLIEKIPKKIGRSLSYIFVVFMVFNMLISSLALSRYSDRWAGKEAANQMESLLDELYPDELMERVYPNAKLRR